MNTENGLFDRFNHLVACLELKEISTSGKYVTLQEPKPNPDLLLEAFSIPGSRGTGRLIINDKNVVDITYLRLASPSQKNMLRIHYGNRVRDSRVIIDVNAGKLTISVKIDKDEEAPRRTLNTMQAENEACSIHFARVSDVKAVRSSAGVRIPIESFKLRQTFYPKEHALYIIPIIPDKQIVIHPSVFARNLAPCVDIPLDNIAFLSQTQIAGLLKEIDPGLNVPTIIYDEHEYPDYERIILTPHSSLGIEIANLMKDWLKET